ncbi:hypothetical protein GGI20_003585 [Coemansia sp. BCRC 34301]|nr:hypothetical protein GGI20_003585 [Coemansia sp. BCRC 34301]
MCDRNLHTSIKSKQDLESCSVRELRAYLQLYGLYQPNTMIEKSDLVSAIYTNSPVPQANEKVYRDSLPRPSGSVSSAHQQQQQQHARSRSNGSERTTNWDRMFSDIGNEIGRGMENLGQQLGEIFEPRQDRPANSGHVPSYDSRTYSHAASRSQRPQPSRSQPQFQPPRPHSAQGFGDRQPTTTSQPGPAPAVATSAEVPSLKDLVRNNTNVSGLSIKALKALLAKYHVDYTNIVEKQELVQRVERLVVNTKLEMEHEAAATAASTHSNSQSGNGGGTNDADDNLCRICWDAATNSVFLNCGHMCTCLECGEKIVQSDRRECPICREYITRIVHVFRA